MVCAGQEAAVRREKGDKTPSSNLMHGGGSVLTEEDISPLFHIFMQPPHLQICYHAPCGSCSPRKLLKDWNVHRGRTWPSALYSNKIVKSNPEGKEGGQSRIYLGLYISRFLYWAIKLADNSGKQSDVKLCTEEA